MAEGGELLEGVGYCRMTLQLPQLLERVAGGSRWQVYAADQLPDMQFSCNFEGTVAVHKASRST